MSIAVDTHLEPAPPALGSSSVRSAGLVALGKSARLRWRAGVGVALAGLVGALGYVISSTGSAAHVPLLTHTIARGDLVVSVTEQGTLESSNNREIKCKVKGESTVVWVIETGTEVKPGDLLIRLDTAKIEDDISTQKIAYEKAVADRETAAGEAESAQVSITEYVEGKFKSEQALKQKELVIAQSQLKSAQNSLTYYRRMFRKGFASQLEIATHEDGVKHAELDVKVKETELSSLERFGKPKMVEELQSKLKTAEAKQAAAAAAVELESARLKRTQEQLANCEVHAEVAGLVMYPSVAEWMNEPDIKQGAKVREDQVLLMIPDLQQMQVKVGVHESKVDRIKPGLSARMELKDEHVSGKVLSIAAMAKPTGWWAGNMVKYDTIVKLEPRPGLKPGMSAAVEIFLDRYADVVRVPVAAVVEQEGQFWCWVENGSQQTKRTLKLGDTNNQFIVVESGLTEGDRVVLNPLDLLDEAQREALKPKDKDPVPEAATSAVAHK